MYWTFDKENQIKKFQQLNQLIKLHYELYRDPQKQQKFKVNSVSQLGSLLKHKNNKYNNNRERKDRVLQENRIKGNNIKQLCEKVRALKYYKDKNDKKESNDEESHFKFQKIDRMSQNQYLSKNMEYSMLNVIQSFMYDKSYRSNQNRKLVNKIMKGKNLTSKQSIYARIATQPRSFQKKNIYIKVLTNLISNFDFKTSEQIKNQFNRENKCYQRNFSQINFIGEFAQTFRTKFWLILQDQTSSARQFAQKRDSNLINAENQNYKQYQVQLILSSLRQVQMEYNKALPSNYESMQNYLWNVYLNKLEKQNNEEKENYQKGLLWGIAYLLYRSGRKQAFYNLLTTNQRVDLFQEFLLYDQSIQKHKPKCSINFWSEYESEDIFYNQLLFILKGDPKFSSSLICDPNSLDFVWITLRSLGLYINNIKALEKFDQLRKDLFKRYLQQNITESKISNMLYLLGYSDIIDISPNSCIDKDDLIHFLISLVYNPFLIRNQQIKLKNKLTNLLSSYILELISENRQQYIYYILLIPEQNFIKEVSLIISNSHLVKDIDWNFFQKKLIKDKYQQLVRTTLHKYLNFSGDYILVSLKYAELLNDYRTALNIIFQMLISSIIRFKFQEQLIIEAQKQFQKLMGIDYILQKQYRSVFNLLVQTRKLWHYHHRRQENKIIKLVGNSLFLIKENTISVQVKSVLQELLNKNGLDVYFYFLQYVTKGMEFALINKGNLKQVQNIYLLVKNSLDMILQEQECKIYSNREIVINLRNHLKTSLSNSIRF